MSGNLIDSDGFPRADVDIHMVRSQRNRFYVLKTDHKIVSDEMEKYMHMALAPPANGGPAPSSASTPSASAAGPAPSAQPPQPVPAQPSPSQPGTAASSSTTPPATARPPAPFPRRQPFALVDLVTPDSPAASAGLQLNDKIVAFGAVSLHSFATPRLALGALPGVLREHENQELQVLVDRGVDAAVAVVPLSLTPRRWSGQGLLGCHVVPLDVSQEDAVYRPDVATAVAERTRSIHGHGG